MQPECDYDRNFWEEMETEINDSIPEIIKIVLSKCGFDSRLSICNINVDDIKILEDFAHKKMKEKLKPLLKNLSGYDITKISREEPFRFVPGHQRTIFEMGKVLASSREALTFEKVKHITTRVPMSDTARTNLEIPRCNNIANWVDWSWGKVCFNHVNRNLLTDLFF